MTFGLDKSQLGTLTLEGFVPEDTGPYVRLPWIPGAVLGRGCTHTFAHCNTPVNFPLSRLRLWLREENYFARSLKALCRIPIPNLFAPRPCLCSSASLFLSVVGADLASNPQ